MNKLLAILCLLGAIGALGLSQRDIYTTQDRTFLGAPVGEERAVEMSRVSKIGFAGLGIVLLGGFGYFVTRIRTEDTRK
jgi:hypothetical protein